MKKLEKRYNELKQEVIENIKNLVGDDKLVLSLKVNDPIGDLEIGWLNIKYIDKEGVFAEYDEKIDYEYFTIDDLLKILKEIKENEEKIYQLKSINNIIFDILSKFNTNKNKLECLYNKANILQLLIHEHNRNYAFKGSNKNYIYLTDYLDKYEISENQKYKILWLSVYEYITNPIKKDRDKAILEYLVDQKTKIKYPVESLLAYFLEIMFMDIEKDDYGEVITTDKNKYGIKNIVHNIIELIESNRENKLLHLIFQIYIFVIGNITFINKDKNFNKEAYEIRENFKKQFDVYYFNFEEKISDVLVNMGQIENYLEKSYINFYENQLNKNTIDYSLLYTLDQFNQGMIMEVFDKLFFDTLKSKEEI